LCGEHSFSGGVIGHREIIHQISTKSREFSGEFSEDLQSPLGQLIATRPPGVSSLSAFGITYTELYTGKQDKNPVGLPLGPASRGKIIYYFSV
jgi:hypothetical protein